MKTKTEKKKQKKLARNNCNDYYYLYYIPPLDTECVCVQQTHFIKNYKNTHVTMHS